MADIAASDVTYTLQGSTQRVDGGSNTTAVWKVVFGDGALTYPSGGVPLTKAKLGCPNHIKAFRILDGASGTGLVHKYDYANVKLRIYEVNTEDDTDKSLVELDAASDAPAAQTLYVEVVGY